MHIFITMGIGTALAIYAWTMGAVLLWALLSPGIEFWRDQPFMACLLVSALTFAHFIFYFLAILRDKKGINSLKEKSGDSFASTILEIIANIGALLPLIYLWLTGILFMIKNILYGLIILAVLSILIYLLIDFLKPWLKKK